LLRDRDRIFGHEFVEQVKAMGIQARVIGSVLALATGIGRARALSS
jgi:hypothetical protein